MKTTITVCSAFRRLGSRFALPVVAVCFATLPHPAAGQETQGFSCTGSVQTFVVPAGVTSLSATLHGGHGSYPDLGAKGGFGGYVQATLSVSPSQTLYVWVGCIASHKLAWGYGNGGYKGVAPGANGDSGFGGGGTAVTLDAQGQQPLLVAGGGGGGGGDAYISGLGVDAGGGVGGNGGNPAGNGHDGQFSGQGGLGGILTTRGNGGVNGAAGVSGNDSSGAGGAGGGGYAGGDHGQAGQGGGGGGGGLSFAAASATGVTFATSQLSKDGAVYLSWSAGTAAEADGDGVPDALDQCEASDLNPTVVIDECETDAPNHLDVDGCTLSDLIAQVAAGAKSQKKFINGVVHLTKDLRRQNLLTRDEKQAIRDCAAKASLP